MSTCRVRGIGGVFLRASDYKGLNEWYRRYLGVPITEDGCAVFKWRDHSNPMREHATVWSAFPKDTDYFGNESQQCMINYIVEDLDEALSQLRAAGIEVDEATEESEFGRFGWLSDPEGNRIELWEPPK